jgi:ethanolamine ammonia-lyase small subunit
MLLLRSVACKSVDADQLAVELVIHTASGVLTGRFGPREAVTILASQAPHARSRAVVLSERDPRWSATHAELLGSIIADLSGKLASTPQPRDLQAVVSELHRVVQALTTASP